MEEEHSSTSSSTLNKRRSDNCESTKNELRSDEQTNEISNNRNECRQLSLFTLSGFIRILSVPVKFFCKNVIDLIKFTWSLLGFNQPSNTDPLTDVSNFIQDFEAKYGTQHPLFYSGSYNQAVLESKRG